MTILTYKSKSLPMERPEFVRSISNAITPSGIMGGGVMSHRRACKNQRMSRRLSGARGSRGRGFSLTSQTSKSGSGVSTQISVQRSATANNSAFACRNMVSSASLEQTSGSHNGFDGVENVENSVFNSDFGNEEPPETNSPVLFNELNAKLDNILMVEQSAVKGDKESITQSLNLCKW